MDCDIIEYALLSCDIFIFSQFPGDLRRHSSHVHQSQLPSLLQSCSIREPVQWAETGSSEAIQLDQSGHFVSEPGQIFSGRYHLLITLTKNIWLILLVWRKLLAFEGMCFRLYFLHYFWSSTCRDHSPNQQSVIQSIFWISGERRSNKTHHHWLIIDI